jgi:hypothetical protein
MDFSEKRNHELGTVELGDETKGRDSFAHPMAMAANNTMGGEFNQKQPMDDTVSIHTVKDDNMSETEDLTGRQNTLYATTSILPNANVSLQIRSFPSHL